MSHQFDFKSIGNCNFQENQAEMDKERFVLDFYTQFFYKYKTLTGHKFPAYYQPQWNKNTQRIPDHYQPPLNSTTLRIPDHYQPPLKSTTLRIPDHYQPPLNSTTLRIPDHYQPPLNSTTLRIPDHYQPPLNSTTLRIPDHYQPLLNSTTPRMRLEWAMKSCVLPTIAAPNLQEVNYTHKGKQEPVRKLPGESCLVDEHFNKSLSSMKKDIDSVDEHFIRSLGYKWINIKNQ